MRLTHTQEGMGPPCCRCRRFDMPASAPLIAQSDPHVLFQVWSQNSCRLMLMGAFCGIFSQCFSPKSKVAELPRGFSVTPLRFSVFVWSGCFFFSVFCHYLFDHTRCFLHSPLRLPYKQLCPALMVIHRARRSNLSVSKMSVGRFLYLSGK